MAKKSDLSTVGTGPAPQIAAITKHGSKRRLMLVKQFIESVVFGQYRQLVGWRSVTGQSSQLDSGYLGQQLVSLLTGVPGSGSRGKGLDLLDGSEVKAASTLSGVDVPRWNNQLQTKTKRDAYLNLPAVYFVLFDTVHRGAPFPLRIRIWRVDPRSDKAFRGVIRRWAKVDSSGNFQLHPPCWRTDDITTNEAGDLHMPLMFKAQQVEIGMIDYMEVKRYSPKVKKCRVASKRKVKKG